MHGIHENAREGERRGGGEGSIHSSNSLLCLPHSTIFEHFQVPCNSASVPPYLIFLPMFPSPPSFRFLPSRVTSTVVIISFTWIYLVSNLKAESLHCSSPILAVREWIEYQISFDIVIKKISSLVFFIALPSLLSFFPFTQQAPASSINMESEMQ